MEVTLGRIVNAWPSLQRLAAQPMTARHAYRVKQARSAAQGHVKSWDETRVQTLERHGAQRMDNGQFDLTGVDTQAVATELDEAAGEAVEIEARPLPLSALDDASVSADDLEALDWLIDDDGE